MRSKTKVAAFAMTAVVALALAACGSNSGTTTAATDENSNVEEKTITTTTVTFPKIYFSEDKTADENVSSLEAMGCTGVTANEDGSYTATMSTDKYNELVDGMHDSVTTTFDGWAGSENYPNVATVEYDDQFASVTITLSTTTIGLQDMFDSYAAGLVACMYQQIAAQPVSCHVVVKSSAGDVLSDNTYPDDWKSTDSGTSESSSAN